MKWYWSRATGTLASRTRSYRSAPRKCVMFILLRVANRPSDDRMMYVRDTGMTKLRTHTITRVPSQIYYCIRVSWNPWHCSSMMILKKDEA